MYTRDYHLLVSCKYYVFTKNSKEIIIFMEIEGNFYKLISSLLHDEVTRTIAAGSYNLELEARKNVTPQK